MSDTTAERARSNGGWEAFGAPVPDRTKAFALGELRRMHPDLSTEEEMTLVGRVAGHVEADRPYEAMQAAREVLDLTGAYRLLAAVCAAPVEREP